MGASRWRRAVTANLVVACTLLGACTVGQTHVADPITINWNTTHQVIDGFGASATGYIEGFTPAFADQFFSPEIGLGLSILRIRPIADTLDADCECVANNVPYHCVQGSRSQIVSGDLQIAQLAAARNVRLIAVPWSPPAEMKSSGKYCSGGSMKGETANYSKYAAELASAFPLLRDKGVSIDALSVQNEPEVENAAYDTCRWTGQQIHDFIPILSSALSAAGFESVQIAAPEESTWDFDLLSASLNDPQVAGKIGMVFGHAYESQSPSGIPSVNGRHVWQTEASDSKKFDGSISDGLRWAHSIHNYMTIGANAWMYWSLACGPSYFNHSNNMCLTDQRNSFGKRAYVLGQFAKFVRPGWQRVGVTNGGSLLVTAYRGPRHQFAVAVINTAGTAVSNQSFVLNGATSQRAQIIPWLTSASASLQPQSPIPLIKDGTAFTYTIPGQSVVTFQGQED